jgi:benzoyl-CoA reductase/2-hydroxyglutaryl-CoA dehydratase subunit BcrC/BadD/HgdB
MKDWSPVPVLAIDVGSDDTNGSSRIRGRVEAFLEMLASVRGAGCQHA